jgi:hypothetical protein
MIIILQISKTRLYGQSKNIIADILKDPQLLKQQGKRRMVLQTVPASGYQCRNY